jgi:hypothetical protein
MRTKQIIKYFDFNKSNYNLFTLGNNVRVNVDTNYLQLKEVSNGIYSTDSDLYASTWITNPNSVKQWQGFECIIENALDEDLNELTGVNFRLTNGVSEYWHNGVDWEINNIDWNTEEEVANNISDFPIAEKKIGVIVNPYTTNSSYTPLIKGIKILYSVDIEFQQDYIYRTLVRQLKEQIRPITDYAIKLTSESSTIDLNDFEMETPYDIIDIDSVYNETNDADHFTNLLQSYNSSTKIITLSDTIDEDEIAYIKLIYRPVIAVTTGLDYYEVTKLPTLTLTNINLINTTELSYSDSVLNKSTGIGVTVKPPKRSDMDVSLNIITNSAADQVRLADELKRFFANNTYLTSWGLDEKFRLQLIEEYDGQVGEQGSGVYAGKLRFLIIGTLYYLQDATVAYSVERFRLTGDVEVDISN